MRIATVCLVLLTVIPLMAIAQELKKLQWPSPPPMQIDPAKQYFATLDTSKGTIVLELFPKEAPKTVNSFVFLARQGFYDGTEFHRVIPGFMIQGGDRHGEPKGTGGPGYEFEMRIATPSEPTSQERWAWPTAGRIPTAASFSSWTPPTSSRPTNTRSSANSRRGRILCTPSRR
jgi:hypothetical protein